MKNFLLIIICILFFQVTQAQDNFITVWKPSNTSTLSNNAIPYVSNSNQIWFPGRGNNFTVQWEEVGFPMHNGVINNVTSSVNFLIDFGTPMNANPNNATYTVSIENGSGNFTDIKFGEDNSTVSLPVPIYYNNGDAAKLLQVSQWRTTAWSTFEYAFAKCQNMDVTATDIPNLSNVTNMSYMFVFCNNLIANATINNWNTSNVTNMRYLFSTDGPFNQPVGNWDVSNVTDMGWMFHFLYNFNQPLSNWNTANVTKMDHMFHGCVNFNQPLNNWDTSNVTDMNTMLATATSFNQNLSNWNVSSVIDFSGTFSGATSFNQNLGMWTVNSMAYANGMLANTGLNCQNYDNTLYGWRMNPATPNNIVLGLVAPLKYSNLLATDARNYLINTKGWTITGDSYDGECESSILATNDTETKSLFQIYPNPATHSIFIKSKEKIKYAEISDASGRVVSRVSNPKEEINIQQLPKGNYFLKIETENKKSTLKFIKN
ncbi:hypothetical protein CHRY9390_02371 [Chryseobacterium aquaeductus]|uniref:Secretion system C-terminal sorting domain-containing protein n=1 Tax=Chryseobacterium aquaeductus TaxID=2675056 RepID=A0A9N8MPR5_9FLAO|nr:BspA family leucine-rich repeat surface protein [Chryseobacterium aquaeductus]CAA7331658.1 hypothetical protein CHRY9390_02371 [Chryseobacterium potabilaquae]CAD7811527.1 hypothetical protein CHRY9390_02371 [Chryseobacterium aquaeductus]